MLHMCSPCNSQLAPRPLCYNYIFILLKKSSTQLLTDNIKDVPTYARVRTYVQTTRITHTYWSNYSYSARPRGKVGSRLPYETCHVQRQFGTPNTYEYNSTFLYYGYKNQEMVLFGVHTTYIHNCAQRSVTCSLRFRMLSPQDTMPVPLKNRAQFIMIRIP